MRAGTVLPRQVHPLFVQEGRVTSQVFKPTPKDAYRLSVENGDRISARQAWLRFTQTTGCSSAGVMAVTLKECHDEALAVIEDGDPYPEHCVIDFSPFGKSDVERKSKTLARHARLRGWLFQPPDRAA